MISTHILDTHLGIPASGVTVSLQRKKNSDWEDIDSGVTDNDGRIVYNCPNEKGIYKLSFSIEDYYQKNQQDFFFVDVPVIFNVTNTDRKYHVPLLLNPFGYTTYRGS
tara:strand:+ start:243341 stop:243664 length:324 start_codon:yes stop_codon:yes gene_type:complete